MQYHETALITTSKSLGTDHQKSYGGEGGGWGMFEPQEFFFRYQIHRMQIWLTSRPARVSVRESEASEASRVLF